MRGRKQCDPVSGCGKFYKQYLTACPSCGVPDAFSNFVPFNPLDWIYDEECYPNIFTASFKHALTGQRMFFEISERCNDWNELIAFLYALKENKCRLVGFNNIGYDYPILHFIIENAHYGLTYHDIYRKSKSIIDTPWEDRYSNIVWDSDVHIQQIDLMKVHHFDNKARRTGLKMLEFNMRSQNIEDLPYESDVPLTLQQMPGLCIYNDHDVDETEKFYIESLEMLDFREELGKKYGRNFINHSDKKIGTDIFVMEIEKASPGSCYTYDGKRKVKRQTHRDQIVLNDIIFPYINFKERGFELVKQYLQSMVITKTKGALEYLTVSPEMAFMMNPEIIKVYGLPLDVATATAAKKGVLLSKCRDALINRADLDQFKFVSGWKDKTGLNIIVDGFRYDFGTGGLHGSIDSTIVVSDDEYEIWDWDAGGYYPEVGGANSLYPEHLGMQFCITNEDLKQERKKYKKGAALNNSIKLARNGAFGDTNNEYSPLKDPQYTMSITINGQLLLCMLAQYLIDIPGLKMIQINTDGLTVKCPRTHVDQMKQICKWWDEYTCLELESATYSRMFIRDVNNYIAEYEGGKLKNKGAYVYKTKLSQGADWTPNDKDWHQNQSSLVIAKAAEAALVRGEDIETFIRGHDDIFDFMLRTKVPRAEKLVIVDAAGNERKLQNITRYYIGIDGGSLVKISPPAKGHTVGGWKRATKLTDEYYNEVIAELQAGDWSEISDLTGELDSTGLPWNERINTKNRSKYQIRRTGYNVGRLVAPCNDIRDADFDNIDFDYYIKEAKLLVDPLTR